MQTLVKTVIVAIILVTFFVLFDHAMTEDSKSICRQNEAAMQSCGKLNYD